MTKRFILHDQRQIDSAIDYIKTIELGGIFEIVIRKHIKNRSDNQNRLYWKYLEVISNEVGHTKDEIHAYFKAKHGIWEVKTVLNESIPIPLSTTKYGTKRFGEYLAKIESEAAVLGIKLPNPNDVWLMEHDYFT
jgi:hypothetical protein